MRAGSSWPIPKLNMLSGMRLRRQHPDVAQIAVILRVVQPITNHKLVRNSKSDILHVHWRQPPFRLIQERGNGELLRVPLIQEALQIAKRYTAIDDVLHN